MSSPTKISSVMAKIMKDAYSELLKNPDEVEKWIKLGFKNIRLLNSALNVIELSIGSRRKIENHLRLIKGYITHMKTLRKGGGSIVNNGKRRSDRIKWEDVQSAFKSRIRTGVITNLKHMDPITFLEDAQFLYATRVKNVSQPLLKINVDLCCEFSQQTSEEIIKEMKHFSTSNAIVDSTTNLKEWWSTNIIDNIRIQLEDFQERGSGWSLTAIVNLAVNVNRYEPFRGSSYIPLPKDIANKQACINVKNEDQECFLWSVISALFPAKQNLNRTSSYPHYSTILNLEGISLPVTLDQIKKFEKKNNISINVFMLKPIGKHHDVVPALLTKNFTTDDRHINLLLLEDSYNEGNDDEVENEQDTDDDVPAIRYHFCWIKNLSRLVNNQLTKKRSKIIICSRCLHYFYNDEKLKNHEADCGNMNNCKISMPAKGEVVRFTNFKNKEMVPFVIYMDMESVLKPLNEKRGEKTQLYQEHIAFSVGYYFKCNYDNSLSYYRSYRGSDCAKWFANELQQIVEDVDPVYWAAQPMTLSSREEQDFQRATTCHICDKQFKPNDLKVRDHNHITSEFRGAAHNECNINYYDSRAIPVFAHNLSNYDSHFLIRDIALQIEGSIFLLPVNKDKYISFSKKIKESKISFRFVDSFRFLPYSLDKLASYLTELKNVKSEYPNDDQYNLLRRKGVFPYDHIKCADNLEETELPEKSAFYNRLTESAIKDEEYSHAKNVWKMFNIQNLGEYFDLYLKTDVLLLTDVFENFRDTCFNAYGLDPAHYVSAPGLTWDSMLKLTRVELDLITDIDILMFVERGIRGGISQCSNRYAKANNKYMPNYDHTHPDIYLQYYDVNNLYGWAMSQYLPCGKFSWHNNTNIDVSQIPDDSSVGFILEVDLEYPDKLHDVHNDLPLCPEHRAPPNSKQKKLLTTLHNKERYVIHYRALKQALEYGMKILKIHRILEFKQSAWLKPYIELNTRMRTNAKNEFEKTFFKLMNNAAFGKTMEDVRKRKIVKLVSKWNGRYAAKVLIAKPNFHSRTILDENLMIIELNKTEIMMNKPVYVGMSILDISKTKLYEFHYGYMQKNFQSKVLYCDTDSLIYEIRCPDVYDSIKKDISRFDTSDYDANNQFGIPLVNKKVPGLMKDENNGRIMTEFVGLRSKMYSIRVEGEDLIKKAKGVKNYIVKTRISFDDYVDCLINNKLILRNQNSIRSVNHTVYSISQIKIALSSNDDKRCILPHTMDTLAWGHYKLKKINTKI